MTTAENCCRLTGEIPVLPAGLMETVNFLLLPYIEDKIGNLTTFCQADKINLVLIGL